MKKLVVGLLVIGALAAVYTLVKSVRGAEVVTLYTRDAAGREYQTQLWVVEDHRHLWVRAERADSDWLKRLMKTPEVRLERAGTLDKYRAVVVPQQRLRVNRLMAERYGWTDWLVGLIRDSEAVTPIRLDPSS